MTTEDYISYEVAKLLKEKGFDEKCMSYYSHGEFQLGHPKYIKTNTDRDGVAFNGVPYDAYNAPTLQMAMKWLREKHILVLPEPKSFTLDGEVATWVYNIWCDDNCEVDADFFDGEPFEKYEDACEAGIKYCLENFI